MTKRDFIAIAGIFNGLWINADPSTKGPLMVAFLHVSDYFQATYPLFNRGVFYDAIFGDTDWIVTHDQDPDRDAPDADSADDAPLFSGVKPAWIYGQTGDAA